MLSFSNAAPVSEETPDVLSCPGYPLKEDGSAQQLHELLDTYNQLETTSINAAFFFCKMVKDEQGNYAGIERNTGALEKMATAIMNRFNRNLTNPPKISFVIDEDIFKNPEKFARKYANRRPEYAQNPDLARKILLEEAKVIRDCLKDPQFMENIFTRTAQNAQPPLNDAIARSLAKGRIIEHGKENGRATEVREYPLSFCLAKMPEKGLEYPTWMAHNTETGKTLVAIQNASPQTDKMNRSWVFAPDGKELETAHRNLAGKEHRNEQENALLHTLNPQNIRAAIQAGKQSVSVDALLKSQNMGRAR